MRNSGNSRFPQRQTPLVVFGDYIDPEFAFLRLIASPGWIVVDIGAAIGQFTVFAAQLPTSHVYAFEPGGDNVHTRCTNWPTHPKLQDSTLVLGPPGM